MKKRVGLLGKWILWEKAWSLGPLGLQAARHGGNEAEAAGVKSVEKENAGKRGRIMKPSETYLSLEMASPDRNRPGTVSLLLVQP